MLAGSELALNRFGVVVVDRLWPIRTSSGSELVRGSFEAGSKLVRRQL